MASDRTGKAKKYYEYLLANMPAGRERVVFRILTFHIGLKNAVQKDEALELCSQMGARFKDERQFRSTVVKLRKAGVPVCASSGDSGYFLAADLKEYQEFRGREYISKIVDMRETVDAMDGSIKTMFAIEYANYQKEKAAKAGQPSLPI